MKRWKKVYITTILQFQSAKVQNTPAHCHVYEQEVINKLWTMTMVTMTRWSDEEMRWWNAMDDFEPWTMNFENRPKTKFFLLLGWPSANLFASLPWPSATPSKRRGIALRRAFQPWPAITNHKPPLLSFRFQVSGFKSLHLLISSSFHLLIVSSFFIASSFHRFIVFHRLIVSSFHRKTRKKGEDSSPPLITNC